MKVLWPKSKLLWLAVVVAVLLIIIFIYKSVNQTEPDWITATVDRGDIQQMVSVSGFVEAKNTAQLSFPTQGVVTDVFVSEGAEVRTGEVLATLASAKLVAERSEATAALSAALADHNATIAGPTKDARNVTAQAVTNAEQNLARTIALENEKVANARQTLLSGNLTALSSDADEPATAPIITGTYSCDDEGTYIIDMYRSSNKSGYSYHLSGLENYNASAYTDQPSNLGNCGLFIQFTEDDNYNNALWHVQIPNQQSSSYITNKTTYDLATEAQNAAIATAEDALLLAKKEAGLANAAPRTETVSKSQATIQQAQARIAAIDASIADRSVVAPFDGIITDVSIMPGEIAGATAVITILANDTFELTARIPEIDITKIETNQKTRIIFDAKTDEVLHGSIEYLSPLATEIDGVAYFEAKIEFNEPPEWLRGGLNADIDIINAEKTDTLRLPKRFISENENGYTVLTPQKQTTASTAVEVGFNGNDGFMEIIGLNEGDTVIAP